MERNIFTSAIEKRKEIRNRALLYAEYQVFSQVLMGGTQIGLATRDDWKAIVRGIELFIILDEAPTFVTYHLDNWEPLGVFFDNVCHTVREALLH